MGMGDNYNSKSYESIQKISFMISLGLISAHVLRSHYTGCH